MDFTLRRNRVVAAVAAAAVTLASAPFGAEARFHRPHARTGHAPPYAAIVIDANSGRVLSAVNPDSARHPASLTKIMTLYLLFERLEAGELTVDTPLVVSAHAAAQEPSRLGLRAGQSIRVGDAIRAMVTKSANDVAVAMAEAIGGSEREFAALMTRRARALGMGHTTFVNASGLPDPDQITTARDQAVLGTAIRERFPGYYRYFSTFSFRYRGIVWRNHNRLLGRVAGVDGIKTGYTRASGYNLVASVRRGGRRLVAVVLGGRSGRARDAAMRRLIEVYIAAASPARAAAAGDGEPRGPVQMNARGRRPLS
jgi:D-alanyl-D-alanine carboxypeptidase